METLATIRLIKGVASYQGGARTTLPWCSCVLTDMFLHAVGTYGLWARPSHPNCQSLQIKWCIIHSKKIRRESLSCTVMDILTSVQYLVTYNVTISLRKRGFQIISFHYVYIAYTVSLLTYTILSIMFKF